MSDHASLGARAATSGFGGSGGWGPALPDRLVLGQDPVHRALRTETPSSSSVAYTSAGARREARRAQHLEDLVALRSQGPGRSRPGLQTGLGDGRTWRARARGPRTSAHAHVPGQAFGREELFPSPSSTPAAPQLFPGRSRCAPCGVPRAAARLPARASAPASPPVPPEGIGPRFFASSRSDPSRAAFRPRQMRAVQSLASQQAADLTGVSQASAFSMTDSPAVKRRLVAFADGDPARLPRFACPPLKRGAFRSSFLLLVPSCNSLPRPTAFSPFVSRPCWQRWDQGRNITRGEVRREIQAALVLTPQAAVGLGQWLIQHGNQCLKATSGQGAEE